ncbi:MAG: hypothetical protein F6K32_00565 [Desertifilum sp. SIO1I2]|nr:hypothetical protein [Desertifilum sp. SIO1I2]
MNSQPQLPSPEILQKTVDNWQVICVRLDSAIALLDRAHEMIETHILSNPIAAYRLRGHRASASRRLLDD